MRNLLISLCLFIVTLSSFNTWAIEKKEPFKVGILMFDEVQIIDFAAPYEVFGHARFEIYTVSATGKPITTAMGLKVTPDHSFSSLPEMDAIVVPGGDVSIVRKNKQVLNWLKEQHRKVDHVLSVCTGSNIIAESGLLNGLSATTFHRNLDDLANEFPEINVLDDKRYVDNGKIITSAGLSSGIDASLYLVSKVNGIESAKTIAMYIEYDWKQSDVFIRAAMADKHLPTNDYQWPEDAKFSNAIGFGDKNNWYRSYGVVTSGNIDKLLKVFSSAMLVNTDWVSKASGAKNTLLWEKTIKDNLWQLEWKVLADENGKANKLINTLSNLSAVKNIDLAQTVN
ncbi:DJ-1/PfpI family protein [Shewanella psychropiezotolerans]|uniref:DJ-1/PfpI family protein n=1 Tax=Shewanella psychropiezotolerans TaxID=2593655 RepID=A0ABX5WY35_9GAMM|nr:MULTISPECIES: DJ-1/PfpI family protein [Shewanella]MPY23742.1 DJ-1/PfpI family protein [Shewanella sp. YLB-07]QDO84014.1 DJ-1/PfpI family protein [Shewanella psychropiezotolerans]